MQRDEPEAEGVPSDLRIRDLPRLLDRVRAGCLAAAIEGYEDARLAGLCHEGAWEAAIGAIQRLDADSLEAIALGDRDGRPPTRSTSDSDDDGR